MNNIILCGFMGCGKSTVGRNLAKMTGRKFLDMDNYIEETAGMTIPEIFEQQGESGFRELEHRACQALSERSGLIVASGGGALTFERNVAVFRGRDTVVLLDVPLETIRQRLAHDTTRPLLQRPDRDEAMQALYEQRLPLYQKAADVTVPGRSTPYQTAQAMLQTLKFEGKI
jgi:shikimate kinase